MTGQLWLIGMMGAGKSSVGKALAARLQRPFVDIDGEIEARMGCSISELWGARGEAVFRDMEAAQLAAAAAGPPAVIATGGGAVLRPENVDVMRSSGKVVWLKASLETITGRLGDAGSRPLLAGGDVAGEAAELLQRRAALYAAAADAVVDTDPLTVAEAVDEVVMTWNAS